MEGKLAAAAQQVNDAFMKGAEFTRDMAARLQRSA
jgi:hypothetical protein